MAELSSPYGSIAEAANYNNNTYNTITSVSFSPGNMLSYSASADTDSLMWLNYSPSTNIYFFSTYSSPNFLMSNTLDCVVQKARNLLASKDVRELKKELNEENEKKKKCTSC